MYRQLIELSAKNLVNKIKNKEVSVREVIQTYLEHIYNINPLINAFVQIDPESALRQADMLDKLGVKNSVARKLIGLPITVKNACRVLGFSPDKGCVGLKDQASNSDATVVARLRNEGCIILGITNTPELTLGFETDNLLYGRTNNPYHLDYTPGGSSGGESALIAACGSALGIASDGAGSIRVPAHYSGIAGMKATQGRIPFTGNVPVEGAGLMSQFVSFGPMARYVEDLCLVLPIISGPDGRDPHAVPVPLLNPEDVQLSKLRVAVYDDDDIACCTQDTKQVIQQAAKVLNDHVASVVEDRPTALQDISELLTESIFLGGDEGKWLTDILEYLSVQNPSPLLLEFLSLAKKCKFSITELRQRWVKFDQYRMQMLEFMDNYDVILCPVSATPAKKHGTTFSAISDFSYVLSYNLSGWPVVVVRCGTSKDNLPIGVQIVAAPWREDIALAVAMCLEKHLGGWQKPELITNG